MYMLKILTLLNPLEINQMGCLPKLETSISFFILFLKANIWVLDRNRIILIDINAGIRFASDSAIKTL